MEVTTARCFACCTLCPDAKCRYKCEDCMQCESCNRQYTPNPIGPCVRVGHSPFFRAASGAPTLVYASGVRSDRIHVFDADDAPSMPLLCSTEPHETPMAQVLWGSLQPIPGAGGFVWCERNQQPAWAPSMALAAPPHPVPLAFTGRAALHLPRRFCPM